MTAIAICSRLKNVPQRYQALTPGTLNITLHVRDMIKLRILRCRDSLGLSRWALNTIPCILKEKGKGKFKVDIRGDR